MPGPSAALTALAGAGLPTDAFYFGGFLPAKQGQRAHLLESLAEEQATLIFYEAPHRILEALEAVETALGARQVVVARELTKIHEEYLRGTAAEVRAQLAARDAVKGEITLLIGKATEPPPDDTPLAEAVNALIAGRRAAHGCDQAGGAPPRAFQARCLRRDAESEVTADDAHESLSSAAALLAGGHAVPGAGVRRSRWWSARARNSTCRASPWPS